jgi:hypothetical protein
MKSLPQSLLVLVLKRVNQAERLNYCALVSTAWAQAAAMATDDVNCCTSDAKTVTPWLGKHGSNVTRLLLDNHSQPQEDHEDDQDYYKRSNRSPSNCSALMLGTLPCSKLAQLSLYDWSVKLSDGFHPVFLQAATGLTSLDLHMRRRQDFKTFACNGPEDSQDHLDIDDESKPECFESVAAVGNLPALQRFNLSVGEGRTPLNFHQVSEYDQLPSSVIACWSTNLTSLSISGVLALNSFQAFSRFAKLQRLYLDLRLGAWDNPDLRWQERKIVQSVQPPFQQLQALTFLSLCMEEQQYFINPISMPSLEGCSRLLELYLYCSTVKVSSFEGLTGLRVLHLVADSVFQGAATGVAAVFEHIGRMQHLERLVLAGGFLGTTVTLGAGDVELCRGLTASMHLKHLDLRGIKLPRSAWAHLVPHGRQLPHLPDFKLCFVDDPGVYLDSCALEQMAACCPAIRRLNFERMSLFKCDVSLAPLRLLGQLVDLECPYIVDGDASVGALACITSLTRLHGRASTALSDYGLLQLTALTGLQDMTVEARKYQRGRNLSITTPPGPGWDWGDNPYIVFKVSTLQAAKMRHAVYLWRFAAHGSINRQKTGQPAQ